MEGGVVVVVVVCPGCGSTDCVYYIKASGTFACANCESFFSKAAEYRNEEENA